MIRLTVLCILVAAPLALAQPGEKPKGDEVDRLARRLERDARELREEVLSHFRGNEYHRDLEDRLRTVEKLAGRLYDPKERRARANHVREILDKIDEEVRVIDRSVLEMGKAKKIDRRNYDRVRDELNDLHRILYRIRREV
jgi:hypothetical protein